MKNVLYNELYDGSLYVIQACLQPKVAYSYAFVKWVSGRPTDRNALRIRGRTRRCICGVRFAVKVSKVDSGCRETVIPRFSGVVARSIWVSRKSVTKSVTERDMVSWGLGEAILGLVWRKIGIWCVLEFSTLGEVVRFVGLPCGR